MSTGTHLQHEFRPRDFSARLRRSGRHSIADRRRHRMRGRNALAVLGAIALPAFAQPSEWDRFQIGDAESGQSRVAPMPFEQAGSSFPGSAFYYLAAETEVPALGEGIHSDADSAVPGATIENGPGPAARALRVDVSGIDRTRAEQCLTAAIYYEAASEPDSGQRAVAQVVLNRVAHPSYPNTVCGVVFQGSERRTGCQFSFTCDGALSRRPSRLFWQRAQAVAQSALSGFVYTPAGLATHYHTIQVNPYWAPSLHYLGTIGAHRFYRFRGGAGQPATFRYAYGGGEPLAAPHRREETATPATAAAALDPLAIQRQYETLGQPSTLASATTVNGLGGSSDVSAALPNYTRDLADRGGDDLYQGRKLPETTGIKPRYQNSGRWLTSPGA